ncbi:DUF805 domain-containing protein [Microbacterium sp. P02]|uniref:DUF805 domain-containing protein n=1 Tax=unclassified Microbacterium TaxID=2609290 RepID=UPI00366AC56C
MSTPASPPAGWYPDPQDDHRERWWNGLAWTASTRAPEPDAIAALTPAVDVSAPMQTAREPYAPAPAHPMSAPGVVYPYVGSQTVQPYGQVRPNDAWAYGAPPVQGMGSAITSVFRHYVDFSGRAGRPEFWYWYLFNAILTIGTILLFVIGILLPPVIWLGILAYLALALWGLVVFLPTLALEVRRLRDAALPWPLIFLAVVPFGSLVLIALWCQPSKA